MFPFTYVETALTAARASAAAATTSASGGGSAAAAAAGGMNQDWMRMMGYAHSSLHFSQQQQFIQILHIFYLFKLS